MSERMSIVFEGMTEAQERQEFERMFEEDKKSIAKEDARFSALRAEDHHTHCRDCGHFTSKRAWVLKSSIDAVEHDKRPLCPSCWDEYDTFY